jgi:hypothetical protein
MYQAKNHLSDPVMDEVRRNREALSARFGGDARRLLEYLDEQARKSGRVIVLRPPRKPMATPPAA